MLPADDRFDSTLALFADPYRYIGRRGRELGTDAFRARILLRPSVCLFGAEGARLFYDESRFVRRHAAPRALRRTLIGEGGVQGLDDAAHRRRKALFMALMTPERVGALAAYFRREWDEAACGWAARGTIILYDVLHLLLARAVCAWAGIPLRDEEVPKRARQLRSLFDDAAAKSLRHMRARAARRASENWLADLVRRFRRGQIDAPRGSPFEAIALHQGADGRPLPARIAAVELLNLLRPTVAVAVYVTFLAHALHRHPEAAERARDGGEAEADAFVQEVRRFYPFFPLQVARARRTFEWRGHRFRRGDQAVLDLYGTNHDPRLWSDPDAFCPERFRDRPIDPFALVPQGGGDHSTGHRCPGEWITLAIMKAALDRLVRGLDYEVPEQYLAIDFGRLPALPRSGLAIRVASP